MSRSVDISLARIGFAILLCVAAPRAGFGLDPAKRVTQYTLTTFQAKDGLPQETTTAITQAADGAMWIGTPSGLIRFDGARFRRRPLPEDTGPGDHYITGLLTAPDGAIWITTRGDLFRMRDGSFDRWGIGDGLPAGGALGIVMLDDGALALATDQGVVKFNPATGTATLLAVERGARSSTLTVARGQSGRIWGGAMRGLLQLKTVAGTLPDSIDSSGSDIVNAVLEDSRGRLWIGTSLGMRVIIDGREHRIEELDGLWIRCLLEDRDHTVWIGTRGNGAYRFLDGRLERFGAEEGLPDDLVRQIYEDGDSSLWFVTAGGIARLRDGAATPWTVREGLPVPFIWSVYSDPGGTIWVGTSGGGVVRLDEHGPIPAAFSDPGLQGVEIRSFLTDRSGDLWIGTGGNGVARVRGNVVRWFRWPEPPGRNAVYSLFEDDRGRIWVGTGNGLAHLDENGTTTWYRRADSDQPTVVRSIGEDQSRTIWVGTTAGLYRLENDELRPVPGTEAISRSRVHCIHFEPDGALWLATDAGLGRYENERLELIGAEQGLPNQMLYWILDDPDGYFWISNDLGVMRINRSMLEDLHIGLRETIDVLIIGREDGMPSTECNSGFPGGARDGDGRYCFATTNGVGCIDPVSARELEEPPHVEIEEILIDGRVSPPVTDGTTPVFEIPAGARRIEIRYGAVSLTAAEKLSYRYRLEGFDPDWLEVGRVRKAHFTGLPPGRLRFSVTARHGDGPWGDPPAVLVLDVQPAFHQTPLFFLLLALSLIAVAWTAYRVRTAQLRGRAERLRKLVAHRTAELEAANSELARLAIVDPLTDLANRRRLDEILEAEWNRAVRNRTPLSLLMIDIDHFKAFNDYHGHLAGDECLRKVARILSGAARRPGDIAARYGGEEFVILLPETDQAAAAEIAETTRRRIEDLAIPHPASSAGPVLTVSIGHSTVIPNSETTIEALIAIADDALYRAKHRRNSVAAAGGVDAASDEKPEKSV